MLNFTCMQLTFMNMMQFTCMSMTNKVPALYQGGDETLNGEGPARVQFRGGCLMGRAFSFIISFAALLFFFLNEMIVSRCTLLCNCLEIMPWYNQVKVPW